MNKPKTRTEMNSRKIKIALSIGLLNNSPDQKNALQKIKEVMLAFKDEVGNFLEWSQVKNARLNRNHIKETYAVKFEHCTLSVDLISDPATHTQVVQGFQLT